ncbi:hypothetical protein ABZY57_14595 [Streptomyces sp. NPDC006450]|uniref:hypothetical protein n=1 Tax=Streptomyces sp. NPDC006450 TaxID=3155458 RepID=UPI0033AB1B17
MSTERIRHLARTFKASLAADRASPSPCPTRFITGRDEVVVVDTGSTPWTGEMAAPSFMILVARPRR